MKKILFAVIISILLITPIVCAKQGSMKLLAVRESSEGLRGEIADLNLEIRPGTGRVFVDTFPLTKLDTQISMRFAKQIACKTLDADCSSYDFIYTMRTSSAIIGGPSAGGGTTVLTLALLDNLELSPNTSITGTINSGGLIGPVSGIKAKIDAASENGITKVLIPKGRNIVTFEEIMKENIMVEEEDIDKAESMFNYSINLTKYAEERGVELIEVSTVEEAVYHLTGKEYEKNEKELTINKEYSRIMESLAAMLCNRSSFLSNYIDESGKFNASFEEKKEGADEFVRNAEESEKTGDYYSAASYCFRANVEYAGLIYELKGTSMEDVEKIAPGLLKDIEEYENIVDKKRLKTITDLQTYMIVKERVSEAKELVGDALENKDSQGVYLLAFANERFFSARSWAHFFTAKSSEFNLDEERTKQSCLDKISEAEERYQYMSLYFDEPLKGVKKELDKAYEDMENEDYELCFFKASKAKSGVDTIVSMIGVREKELDQLIQIKLDIAKKSLIKAQEEGIFPIVAYSYYEYAKTLSESEDKTSALLFSDYALELSNVDLYFEKRPLTIFRIEPKIIGYLLIGIAIGLLIAIPIKIHKKRKQGKQGTKKSGKKKTGKRKPRRKKRARSRK